MLTVMLAVCNGADTLPVVLEAYLELRLPSGGWKLVIVDNGSTDDTALVLDRFQTLLPMTRLFVPQRGKNVALNAALDLRQGDLVVFTDDDAIPAPDWLHELRTTADLRKEFDIFGGVIRPRWSRPPDPWILDWVPKGITYAITDPLLEDGPIAATSVWGPNMAVRSRIFDAGHRFAADVGPRQGFSYPMGSETEFNLRMERGGYRAWFTASAVVEHIITDDQMERRWVLSRAVRYGRGIFQRERLKEMPLPRMLAGLPRHQIPRLLRHFGRLVLARIMGDAEAVFLASWRLRRDWGYSREARLAGRR